MNASAFKQATTSFTTRTVSHEYQYDQVFTEEDDQLAVFNAVARPAVEDVIEGYNSTIITYGQTASGKTYTMLGADPHDTEHNGIVPRAAVELFNCIHNADENLEIIIKLSYAEIYMEQVSDLLDPTKTRVKLQIRENKRGDFFIENVVEMSVKSPEEFMDYVIEGNNKRAIAATKMNERSSRSHTILMVTVSQRHVETQVVKSGKLYLVDLAGSEMVRKTEAVGRRLEEAKMINRSLSALGMVINNLTDPDMSHVPYRDSKLTRILHDSLGGNSRTTLIVNISCSESDSAETLSTLRFGNRAKKIENQAVINERKSADDLMNTVKVLQKDLQLEKNRVTALKNRLDCATSYESLSASSDHQYTGMRSATPHAHAAAIPLNTITIEAYQQLQRKFTNLEEEFLKVQLESDRRGFEIRDLKAQLDKKTKLSLEIKDIQYSELQSDHERLDFEHKELTIHAEKLQQQIKLLSSKELNRPSCYDTTKLQSPCEGNDVYSSPKKQQAKSETESMVDPLHPVHSPSLTVEDVQGMAIYVEKLKDRSINSGSLLASAKQTALPLELFEKDKTHMHAIHQKLVHLVGVHRQLLRKFATSKMNAEEGKRRVAVRDDRIKKLKASNRQITVSLRKQAEKHVEELIRLRDQISELRGAQEANLQSHGYTEGSIIKPFRGRAAGQLYAIVHPGQWDDAVRPIRGESQCSSASSTSEESLTEVEFEQKTEEFKLIFNMNMNSEPRYEICYDTLL
ncbi:hypothetical protein ABG067_006128 [Albugo candida]